MAMRYKDFMRSFKHKMLFPEKSKTFSGTNSIVTHMLCIDDGDILNIDIILIYIKKLGLDSGKY